MSKGHEQELGAEAQPTPSRRIPWSGGHCPVAPGTRVRVEFRSGKTDDNETAGRWYWGHQSDGYPASYEIVAYEVLSPDWSVEELAEALEPFACVAKYADGDESTRIFGRADYAGSDFREITVGDLRRARAALNRIKGEER